MALAGIQVDVIAPNTSGDTKFQVLGLADNKRSAGWVVAKVVRHTFSTRPLVTYPGWNGVVIKISA